MKYAGAWRGSLCGQIIPVCRMEAVDQQGQIYSEGASD